ncbi:MAG: hypothetical protein KAX19_12810, partial [Candidatus Brocadiae bacterium]|nr:hypothetical protein [Candidatus Brocadiia bacterium]
QKLERFELKDEALENFLAEFTSRQLSDTAYAATEAVRFLGLLYGDQAPRRVHTTKGGITFHLRNEWRLNAILGDGPGKARDDHRHHAVDAVVTALTDAAKVKMLSDAAARARSEGRRQFASIKPPWDGFLDEVRQSISGIVVSHRVSRKVSGALHKETNYSPPRDRQGRRSEDGSYVHVRKPLAGLSKGKIGDIVDPVVRERVRAWREKPGADKHPFLITKDGGKNPIRKVRIKERASVIAVGQGPRRRYVKPGSNHHIEILECKDRRGRTKWEGRLVSRYDAVQRLKAGKPVIRRDHGPEKRFLFSLAGGETIEIDQADGTRGLYIIRTITTVRQAGRQYPRTYYVHLNDARRIKQIPAGQWRSSLIEPLRKLDCRKVVVTPLGEVRTAND